MDAIRDAANTVTQTIKTTASDVANIIQGEKEKTQQQQEKGVVVDPKLHETQKDAKIGSGDIGTKSPLDASKESCQHSGHKAEECAQQIGHKASEIGLQAKHAAQEKVTGVQDALKK